ncbi:hypothetical protein GQ44DRAFT_765760 [Phaeosphaeriaceae sp. PMI808]|nr:hypothetical protein GQ44DRAFT_765760 [Phaeosphaeriaceae sp. PMI808]
MTRHRQKDEEAGAGGCGVLNTRKRMWKDLEGEIVTKKPTLSNDSHTLEHPPQSQNEDVFQFQPVTDLTPFGNQHEHEGAPISPPVSNNSRNQLWDDQDSSLGSGYPHTTLDSNTLPTSSSYSQLDQQLWSQPQLEPLSSTVFDDASFDAIFNPDTANSFNNPFTTMSNYNWLFDMDLSKGDQVQQLHTSEPYPTNTLSNSAVLPPDRAFDMQMGHMNVETPLSAHSHFRSLASHHAIPSQRLSSSVDLTISPLRNPENEVDATRQTQGEVVGVCSP